MEAPGADALENSEGRLISPCVSLGLCSATAGSPKLTHGASGPLGSASPQNQLLLAQGFGGVNGDGTAGGEESRHCGDQGD